MLRAICQIQYSLLTVIYIYFTLILRIYPHSLLPCNVLADKSTDNFIKSSIVHDELLFSWCLQDSLIVFDFRQFDNVVWCDSLWVYPNWSSWIIMSMSFLRLGKFEAIIFANELSAPFSFLSGIPLMRILFFFIMPHESHRSPYFFLFFYLFAPLTQWFQVTCLHVH